MNSLGKFHFLVLFLFFFAIFHFFFLVNVFVAIFLLLLFLNCEAEMKNKNPTFYLNICNDFFLLFYILFFCCFHEESFESKHKILINVLRMKMHFPMKIMLFKIFYGIKVVFLNSFHEEHFS